MESSDNDLKQSSFENMFQLKITNSLKFKQILAKKRKLSKERNEQFKTKKCKSNFKNNSLDGLNSRVKMTDNRISELVDRAIESQSE